MKSILFVFGIVLIAPSQAEVSQIKGYGRIFGNIKGTLLGPVENNIFNQNTKPPPPVIELLTTATPIKGNNIVAKITKIIPETQTLVNEVKKTSRLQNLFNTTIFSNVKDVVHAAMTGGVRNAFGTILHKSVVSTGITNISIPVFINVNNTQLGNSLNKLSALLSIITGVLQNTLVITNSTFATLTNASEQFVTNGLERLIPDHNNSTCCTIVRKAKNDFIKAFFINALYCANNVFNTIARHIHSIESLQKEINTALHSGKIRVSLFTNIISVSNTIAADIKTSHKTFLKCEMDQISKTLMTMAPFLSGLTKDCLFMIVG